MRESSSASEFFEFLFAMARFFKSISSSRYHRWNDSVFCRTKQLSLIDSHPHIEHRRAFGAFVGMTAVNHLKEFLANVKQKISPNVEMKKNRHKYLF